MWCAVINLSLTQFVNSNSVGVTRYEVNNQRVDLYLEEVGILLISNVVMQLHCLSLLVCV